MQFRLLLLFLLYPLVSFGQSKTKAPLAIWPELQINYALSEDGLLFFSNQYRVNTDTRFNDLKENGLFSNFERVELALGYEQKLSEHWRGGGLVRYAAEDYPKQIFYTIFMRHNGNISSLFFNKQLMLEYVDKKEQETNGRVRFSAELGKRLSIKDKFITPSIEVEALFYSGLGKKDQRLSQERFVDRSRIQFNLTYEVSDKVRVNPYFIRQVDYYYVMVPPVYNDKGVLVENGYTTKRNRVSPIIGLELKYTFNHSTQTASITY
jgi:hypothetical protein